MQTVQTPPAGTQVTSPKPEPALKKILSPSGIFLPDVDICESSDQIRLLADMPGVDQNSVEVTVENNVLTIGGPAYVDCPAGYDLVGQEYRVGRYRREFSFPDAVDTGRIKARVRHGVLEVTIPKREEMKSRKIRIET